MAFNMHQEKRLIRLMSVLSGGNSGCKTISELVLAPDPDSSGFLQDLPSLEVLERVQRCETHVLRTFFRAKAELERLQSLRLGNKVPPRIHVEMD